MTTIAEWAKQINSHNIYSHDELAADFRAATGEAPCWDHYLAYEADNGQDRRGAYIEDGVDLNERLASGFAVAEALAAKYASHTRAFKTLGRLSGRGSRYDMAIRALEDAGL